MIKILGIDSEIRDFQYFVLFFFISLCKKQKTKPKSSTVELFDENFRDQKWKPLDSNPKNKPICCFFTGKILQKGNNGSEFARTKTNLGEKVVIFNLQTV